MFIAVLTMSSAGKAKFVYLGKQNWVIWSYY